MPCTSVIDSGPQRSKMIPANSLSGCAARAPDTLEPWWEPLVSLLPRHSHVHDFLGLLPFPADFFLIGLVVNGRQGWILPWLCVLRPERFARPGSQLLKQAQQPPFSDKPDQTRTGFTLAHRRRSCIHILQALLLHTGKAGNSLFGTCKIENRADPLRKSSRLRSNVATPSPG